MIDSRLEPVRMADGAQECAARCAYHGDLNGAVAHQLFADNAWGILHNLVPRHRCTACRRPGTNTVCQCGAPALPINPT